MRIYKTNNEVREILAGLSTRFEEAEHKGYRQSWICTKEDSQGAIFPALVLRKSSGVLFDEDEILKAAEDAGLTWRVLSFNRDWYTKPGWNEDDYLFPGDIVAEVRGLSEEMFNTPNA